MYMAMLEIPDLGSTSYMFKWSTEQYIEEVENGSDPGLQEYQAAEIKFIKDNITKPEEKTFIDVGAGYGRVVTQLAPIAKQVIAIDIDKQLLEELRRRANHFNNALVIEGSGDDLVKLINKDIEHPVLLSLQNTLGPWDGNRQIAIQQLRALAEQNKGELIVSLFCREAIQDWGIPMYATTEGLLGKYDPAKSDLATGIYRTSTNYESYWFSEEEREELKHQLGGHVSNEIRDHKYHIFHITYAESIQGAS
jgi:SAM-dependent methyltransferase